MFVWGLYDDFIYELLLLEVIFSMKRYYVYVWSMGVMRIVTFKNYFQKKKVLCICLGDGIK